jgi:hypothetical protein
MARPPPCIVFEVAVKNESMSTLTMTDVDRYFAIGTGTRIWLGIIIFEENRKTPPIHRWWAGWCPSGPRCQWQLPQFSNIRWRVVSYCTNIPYPSHTTLSYYLSPGYQSSVSSPSTSQWVSRYIGSRFRKLEEDNS